ncbi:MAG: EamA family transporter [Clostridia bacterium]|nr:EamA family transporter [Clostridia bacterium]
MNLIIILCLCLIATAKVTIQGFFAKTNVKTQADGIFFNGLIFFFTALTVIKNAFPFKFPVFLFGAIFGILSVLFQLFYIKAMSHGNVSLTVMMVNLAMIFPIVVSIIFYGEKLTLLRFLGLLLTIVALILCTGKADVQIDFKKWLLFSLLTNFINGAILVNQKIFGKTVWGTESKSFVAYGYIIATLVSVLMYAFISQKGNGITFKIKPSVFLYALSLGVILGLFQVLNTKAIANIESTLLFPTYNGGSLIFSSISGVLILHDRLNKKQLFSIIVGTVAIIMMNI